MRYGAAAGKESALSRRWPEVWLGRSPDRQVVSLAVDQSQVNDQLLEGERRVAQAAGVLPGAAVPGQAVGCSSHSKPVVELLEGSALPGVGSSL